MTDTVPQWEAPPGSRRPRGRGDYSDMEPYVTALKDRPGQWALFRVLSYPPSGGVYDYLKGQGMQVTTRSMPASDGGKPEVRVYVRAPQQAPQPTKAKAPKASTPVEPEPEPTPEPEPEPAQLSPGLSYEQSPAF